MLNEFKIKNFQIHKKKTITFTKGINFIIGDTESGKSAIIRALILLLTGSPRAGHTKYKNKQSKGDLLLEITTDKGNKIKRIGKYYYINDNPTPIKGFGTELPEMIKELCPIDTVNIQRQMEPYFIMLDSGNSAAKRINKYTGVEDYDKIQSVIKSEISKINNELKKIVNDNSEINKKLENEGIIKILYEYGIELYNSIIELKHKETILIELEETLLTVQTYQDTIKKLPIINQYIQLINVLTIKARKLKERDEELQRFDYKIKQVKVIKHKLKQQIVIDSFIKKATIFITELKNLEDTENQFELLIDSLDKVKHLKFNILNINNEIDKIKNKLSKIKTCPLCKQTIKKEIFM